MVKLSFDPKKLLEIGRHYSDKGEVDKVIDLYTSTLLCQNNKIPKLFALGDAYGTQNQKMLKCLFEHLGFSWLSKEDFDKAEEYFSYLLPRDDFLDPDERNEPSNIFRAMFSSTIESQDASYANSIIDCYGNNFIYEFDFSYKTDTIVRRFLQRKHDLFCIGLYVNFLKINNNSLIDPLILIRYIKQRYKIPIIIVNNWTFPNWEEPLLEAGVDFIFEMPFPFDRAFMTKLTTSFNQLNPAKFNDKIVESSNSSEEIVIKSLVSHSF